MYVLCVGVYVCIYVCTYVCMYVCMYVRMYVCMCVERLSHMPAPDTTDTQKQRAGENCVRRMPIIYTAINTYFNPLKTKRICFI
jgi:hypothetical protein